jgi:hypothetical protein
MPAVLDVVGVWTPTLELAGQLVTAVSLDGSFAGVLDASGNG